MIKKNIKPVNRSRQFEIDELFFSITDKRGLIRSCNDVFVRVSGYESTELVGEPHNCIRHPDMPKCVFKLFWDHLLDGKSIGAYVKNMAATGEYYWVYALATPLKDGYLSIRIKPTSKYFETVETVYSQILEIEKTYERDWREGMAASHKELMTKLNELGFSNYNEFFNESLREELHSRKQHISKLNSSVKSQNIIKIASGNSISLDNLFDDVLDLVKRKKLINEKADFLSQFAEELELISINSTVQASLLGKLGKPVVVISEELSRMSKLIKTEIANLSIATAQLVNSVDTTSLSVATASLQLEMSRFFKEGSESSSSAQNTFGSSTETLVLLLDDCSLDSVKTAKSQLDGLLTTMGNFEVFIESLGKVFQVLQFSYVSGCAEMARISREEDFKSLFDGLNKLSVSANEHLKILSAAVGSVRHSIKKSLNSESRNLI